MLTNTEATPGTATAVPRVPMLIDGAWVEAASGEVIAIENPANRQTIAEVPRGGADDVKRAVEAAHQAFARWKLVAPRERGHLLLKIADAIESQVEELGRTIARETGNALRTQARPEAKSTADVFRYFGGLGGELKGETIPLGEQMFSYTRREPLGVVGGIIPWNAPVVLAAVKIAPALLAGNTLVLKAAEDAPLGVLMLARLCQDFLPAGVLNVLTGYGEECGGPLAHHPLVRKLSFTGSTEVGKILLKQSAETVKKMSMELGGNAAFIVFDDADLDAAVEGAMMSKYRNTGQTCVCTNRFLVQSGIYDAFAERLTDAVGRLKVADGFAEGAAQGPLIDQAAVEKVEEHIADAVGHGARLLTGGKRHALGGTFFEPTVLADARPDMLVAREETFGPVAPLFRFETEDEAVGLANDTEFGLAAYFYSRDIGRIWRVAEALEYGMVGINEGLISTAVAPFGGVKQSGIGREGSRYGIEEFLEVKYLCMGGLA